MGSFFSKYFLILAFDFLDFVFLLRFENMMLNMFMDILFSLMFGFYWFW